MPVTQFLPFPPGRDQRHIEITAALHAPSLTPMMWMFLAILVTFVVTRIVTRTIRSGRNNRLRNISVADTHVHHQVFGILIMIGTGIALLSATPDGTALQFAGAVFGVGVGLTLDEFALWLYLKDVYWSPQGRRSVDAVFCVLAVTGALVGGAGLLSGSVGSGTWWISVGILALNLVLSVICVLKGKVVTGVVGILVWVVALVGVLRLAKPGSWWDRRWYADDPGRARRARARFDERYQARWNRLRDLVAGTPQEP